MSKGNTFENDTLKLILHGTPIANIADNAASSPLTSLYAALHTADPGEAGDQSTSEITYTSYARAAIARSSSGFTISGNQATLASIVSFPAGTGGSGTATHFSIGTVSSGTGKILYKGPITPNLVCGNGITPRLATGTSITED